MIIIIYATITIIVIIVIVIVIYVKALNPGQARVCNVLGKWSASVGKAAKGSSDAQEGTPNMWFEAS